MTRLWLVALLAAVPACPEHGRPGSDACVVSGEPLQLRDPGDLLCAKFFPPCDESASTAAFTTPPPPWAPCPSSCDTLDEAACKNNASCRVVRDAGCTVGGNTCFTDFLGCFPLAESFGPKPAGCFNRDSWSCSEDRTCEAHHSQGPCGSNQCSRPFATCVPAGQTPGRCEGQVTCDAPTPSCPAGTTPGIANGCFTGACIQIGECS